MVYHRTWKVSIWAMVPSCSMPTLGYVLNGYRFIWWIDIIFDMLVYAGCERFKKIRLPNGRAGNTRRNWWLLRYLLIWRKEIVNCSCAIVRESYQFKRGNRCYCLNCLDDSFKTNGLPTAGVSVAFAVEELRVIEQIEVGRMTYRCTAEAKEVNLNTKVMERFQN